jgi:uncharacterized membrane protein
MPLADYSLGDALVTIIWIFLFVAWIMVLFSIIGDEDQEEDPDRLHPAGQLVIAEDDLKEKGAITDDEFQRLKGNLIG